MLDHVKQNRPAHACVVKGFTPDDAGRWDAFVDDAAGATFFHRAAWCKLIEDGLGHRGHYLYAERDGAVTGILPLVELRSRLFGHALISTPFCVYGGVVARDPDSEACLTQAAADLAGKLGVDYLELRNREAGPPGWPVKDLYVGFRKPISEDHDANLKAIPRKQRAMVRKGIKHGLRGEIDDRVDRFFDLYADNVHRHGTPPFAKRYFARLREEFGDDCELLTVVDEQGKPVSGVMSFYFRNEVLPYYAGDTLAARDLAANDFKYWDLMRRACERGITVFDYGRSKRGTGSFDFKKNWGFEPTPLAYEYSLFRGDAIPQNNPANPKYRAMIAVWRRLPRPVVNAIGPYIVRSLG